MEEVAKCREQSCHEVPTMRVHGPHGLVDYCEKHANGYAGLMRFMGASVLLVPILNPTKGAADAEG